MSRFDSVSTTHPSLFRGDRGLTSPKNHAAWEAFYQKYAPCMRQLCTRAFGLGPDATDEVTQRVLAKLLEKMRHFQYDPKKSFRKWLKRVTANAAVDFLRERQMQPRLQGAEVYEIDEAQLAVVLNDEWTKDYRDEMFGRVLPEVRAKVSLEHWQVWEQLEAKRKPLDVAEQFALTVDNVYQIKKRIKELHRKTIRELMDREGVIL